MSSGTFPDLEIVSSEKTSHCVHRQQLSRVSLNSFAGLLIDSAFSISVVEPALVLDIVLYTIYGMPFTHHNLPLNTIEAAIDALVKYGVAVRLFATPTGPLYPLLLSHAPHHPIDAYAVAGKYGFEDAAVAISAHLLAYDLFLISDELSIKMGPVYLRRLIDLHSNRATALKGIVLRPPEAHPPTATCGGAMQGWLTQAWVFAAAQLAWGTLPSKLLSLSPPHYRMSGNLLDQVCRPTLYNRPSRRQAGK